MKKPLQDQNDQFLILSKGQLIGWGKADVKNLVANANRALKENLKSKKSITIREAECMFAQEWFEAFLEKGITLDVVKKLNSRIGHVRYHHVLTHSPTGLPFWRRIANGDQIDDPELSVAYGVAHLLASGALEGLKRCHSGLKTKVFNT